MSQLLESVVRCLVGRINGVAVVALNGRIAGGGAALDEEAEVDVAVILSAEEYERLRALRVAEFQRFCDQVAQKAAARGMTPEILEQLLSDEDPPAPGH